MSYDVDIGDVSLNYTSNVSGLFYDHMPAEEPVRGGLHNLHGLTGAQAAREIADAFERIGTSIINDWSKDAIGEPDFCAKYDSKNGWGSTVGALVFLANIQGACIRNPRKRVRVDA